MDKNSEMKIISKNWSLATRYEWQVFFIHFVRELVTEENSTLTLFLDYKRKVEKSRRTLLFLDYKRKVKKSRRTLLKNPLDKKESK